MKYDAVINDNEHEFFNHETRGNMLLNSINKIVEPGLHNEASKLFLFSLDTISKQTLQQYMSFQTPSLENKRNKINELLNMVVVQRRNLRYGEQRLKKAEDLARELIEAFKEEYHLN